VPCYAGIGPSRRARRRRSRCARLSANSRPTRETALQPHAPFTLAARPPLWIDGLEWSGCARLGATPVILGAERTDLAGSGCVVLRRDWAKQTRSPQAVALCTPQREQSTDVRNRLAAARRAASHQLKF
jgi:hypothetical protein